MHGAMRTFGRLAATAAVAAVVMAGSASGAGAADARKQHDYGSKAQFKFECELMGGKFIEDGLGNTECHWPNGAWVECDANGNDCWHTPAPKRQPGGGRWDHVLGSVDGVLAPVDGSAGFGGINAPGDAIAPPTDGSASAGDDNASGDASAPTADRDEKPEKGRHKKGNGKGKQRGQGGKSGKADKR